MIGNILDNTTELYMIKYAFGEIFSSGGATLCKNPSDQTVAWGLYRISQLLYSFSWQTLRAQNMSLARQRTKRFSNVHFLTVD